MENQFADIDPGDIVFLEDGPILNQFIFDDEMPLIIAVVCADESLIEEMLSLGVEINAVDKTGKTALHWAAKCENVLVDAVDILLQHGANVAARDIAGRTPLHYATRVDDATKLLDAGADPNAQDKGGCTPLHLAVEAGAMDVIKVLLSRSAADVNARAVCGITVLMFAMDNGFSGKTIELLIEAGADINLKDDLGATALSVALELDDVEAMLTLIRHGAGREDGRTILHATLRSWDDAFEEFLDALLQDADNNLNSSAFDGTTPLMIAARCANGRVVEKLIIAGAAVDAVDNIGNTALHWAVYGEEVDTLIVLLEHGANINARNNNGETPLFLAARYGIDEICMLLLRNFAEIYIRDHMGRLPMDAANEEGHADVVFLFNRQSPAAG